MLLVNTAMEIDACIEEGNYLVSLRGELDASSSILLDDSIRDGLAKNPRSVRIDCAGLCYISSAGLGVLISHLQEMRAKAIPLVVFALREPVANVFEVLGLGALIPMLPDREQAGLYCEHQLGSLTGKAGAA